MKVLDGSPVPAQFRYVKSSDMTTTYLRNRWPLYRKKVAEEKRKAEEANQQTQRPEEWR